MKCERCGGFHWGDCPPSEPEKVGDFKGAVDGGGYKASMDVERAKKPPLHFVPGALVRACARALGYGAKKYAPNNWRRGMAFSETLRAMENHLDALKDGEALDPESGLHHLDHIAANVAFLAEYLERPEYAGFDDLFKRGPSNDFWCSEFQGAGAATCEPYRDGATQDTAPAAPFPRCDIADECESPEICCSLGRCKAGADE